MIKAIVFDIGGVLLRTEDYSARQKLEQQYDLPPGGSDDLVFHSQEAEASTIGKMDAQSVWENVANRLSLTKQELELFRTQFWMGDRLDFSLVKYIKGLRPKYTTALLSNAWQGFRNALAQDYGIEEPATVDHILISSELGVAKPDHRIYQILSEEVKCAFHSILFVDDFIENIKAAQELAIQTIHYQKGMDLINEIKLRL